MLMGTQVDVLKIRQGFMGTNIYAIIFTQSRRPDRGLSDKYS